MYNEDDHLITPQALVSWAIDTELLEPLGFTRGFLRSEYCGGRQQHLNDYCNPDVRLTQGRRKVDRLYTQTNNNSNATFEHLLNTISDKYGSELCPSTGKHGTIVYTPCPIHANFFSPEYSYQGMWLLSHTQLQSFMTHDIWNITYCKEYIHPIYTWGIRERAASYNVYINIPPGFQHNKVIPFYHIHGKNRLSRLGILYHLSANYCEIIPNKTPDKSYLYPPNHIYTIHKNHTYIENNNSYYID